MRRAQPRGSYVTSTLTSAPCVLSAAGALTEASTAKSLSPAAASASLYVSGRRRKLTKRKRSVCASPRLTLKPRDLSLPAGSAVSTSSYTKAPSSALCSVSVAVPSWGSRGRHSTGSSARPPAGTTSEAGTVTSARSTAALKETSASSGLRSGSRWRESWRSGACISMRSSAPAAAPVSASL